MLISRSEMLAQELRRQDLLTRARHDHACRDHQLPDPSPSVRSSPIRRVVDAALIRTGTRLRGVPRREPMGEPALSTPPA